MRTREEVEADVRLFTDLYWTLKEEVDKGVDEWDIDMVRFCLENMGWIVGKPAPAMLDYLQRMGKRTLLTDQEMFDRTLALIPGEPVYRLLDEIFPD